MDKIGKKRAKIIISLKRGLSVDQIAKQVGINKSYVYMTRKWFNLLPQNEQKQVIVMAVAKLEAIKEQEQKPAPEPDHKMDGFHTPYNTQRSAKRWIPSRY